MKSKAETFNSTYLRLMLITSLIFVSSCGFKINSFGSNKKNKTIISGIVSPLIGSIAESPSRNMLFSSSYAAVCADPVYVQLFHLQTDGTIDESQPIISKQLGADAKYIFDFSEEKITPVKSTKVEYVVKVSGCNSEVYKRPVTNFDNKQDIDAKTTVVAEVINISSLLSKNLKEAERTEVDLLIKSLSGASTNAALNSLTNDAQATTKFNQIFGSSPSVILDAKPEVQLISPTTSINELMVGSFSASAFHVDPNYSFVYRWKLDGVVKSSSASWSYIPGANESGLHNIDFYVGKDDGAGNIDLTKPYYTKQITVVVNNNILPVAPNIALNSATPSPVNNNSIQVDLSTGVSKANCQSFSHLAITDSPSAPGLVQFNIDCTASGTQTENVTFSSGDGAKTLYLWAIDSEGNISAPKTVSLVLDSLPPVASLSAVPTLLKGSSTEQISLTASDAGVGLTSVDLLYSVDNGVTYNLITHLGLSDSSYSWSVPSLNSTTAKLKLVAVDGTGSTTVAYSNLFAIDSSNPTAPVLSRTSSATSSSKTVSINVTCTGDYYKILFAENSSAPALTDSAWENCASTKNFTVSSGDGVKTIYAFTRDAAGNLSTASQVTMTLDTTPPAAPAAALASAAISSSSTVNFTVADCTDRSSIFVSESIVAPAAGDSGWQACSTTASAMTYALPLPAVQGVHNFYVYAKDAVGNVSLATTGQMSYDNVAPTAALSTTFASLYKGGDTIALNFSASDESNLSSLKLEYTSDGTTYSTIATLSTSATSYSWTVPVLNTVNAKVRLIASDNAITANTTTISGTTFTIDSAAPNAPTLTRTSAAITTSPAVTMTVGSCTDTTSILITESSSQPAASSTGWQTCSTTAGATTATVSGEGVHTLYAWAKDSAGNIATSANSVSMTLDTTVPTITIGTVANTKGNGTTGNVSWTMTEANAAASSQFVVEMYNGTSWQTVGTVNATAGNNNNLSYTLSNFTVPDINITNAAIRVTFSDAANNSATATSNTFTIDSLAPVLASVVINDGAQYAGTSMVSVKVNVADNYSTGNQIQLRMAVSNSITDDCQSEYANNNWAAWTNSTTNIPFTLVPTDGVKKICVWAKDSVGNITVMNPTSGSAGVNSNSIIYSAGNPPQLLTFTVEKTNGGGTIATAGDPLTISWSASDIEGLDNNPVSFAYTTDNVTWKDLTTNLTIATTANITWGGNLSGYPTGATGTVTSWTAPASTYFRVRAQVKDMAGNTSLVAMSQPFNTGSWSVYAGSKDRGDGGTGRAAALTGAGYWNHFAINPKNGDIYAVDHSRGLRKLDAKTGLVSTFLKQGANTLPSNGPILSTTTLSVDVNVNPIFDSKGRLYLGQTGGGYATAAIYQIDLETNTSRLYAGGGVNDDGGNASTTLQITSGGYSFDEQDSLYVWTNCGGAYITSLNYGSVSKRIVKIAQNSDGTPGTTTRVIGTCTTGAQTSGAVATTQPAMTAASYTMYTAIIPWDNGNKILVIPYSTAGARYKIINGLVYASNISAAPSSGIGAYNPVDGYVYRSNATGIEKVLINTAGDNGDTTTQYFTSNSTAAGCTADGVTTSGFCGIINTQLQIRSGIVYFSEGAGPNNSSNYAIRYFDGNNQLRTVFGSQPFYGDGMDKSIMRGTISGIYYKKASELNQTAFPEGLYFIESAGLVFGHIDPVSHTVSQLVGNQARLTSTPATGTAISKNVSLGNAYTTNGQPLTFDKDGLPWFRANVDVLSIDSNRKIVRRTNQSAGNNLQVAPQNANPSNYGLFVYAGAQNFALKNYGLFVMPNYVNIGYDPAITIRLMDFTNLVSPTVLGGTYVASSNTAASADVTTPGGAASAPLWTSCRGNAGCFMRYDSGTDRLYFVENNKLRYLTTPDNTATSTLLTLFTAGSALGNFSLTPDGSQLWYFKISGGLYCYDLSSGKSWCDNTTDHFSIRAAAGLSVSAGADQMTFKDNQTMFVSTYQGEILQFNLPTTP